MLEKCRSYQETATLTLYIQVTERSRSESKSAILMVVLTGYRAMVRLRSPSIERLG